MEKSSVLKTEVESLKNQVEVLTTTFNKEIARLEDEYGVKIDLYFGKNAIFSGYKSLFRDIIYLGSVKLR